MRNLNVHKISYLFVEVIRDYHFPISVCLRLQVFFVESVCDDPEVIAANILVCCLVWFAFH